MRIITLNVNGIRAAARKGLFRWLVAQRADVVCLQETRAQEHQIDGPPFHPPSFSCFYEPAQRPGYSGVALFSRREPDRLIRGFGWDESDREGRYLQADFGKLSVVSLYMPSGSSGEMRQAAKFRFLDRFMPHLRALRRQDREFVICGDWNIAHKAIDLKNWQANQNHSGFLPEERAWLDQLFDRVGFVDAFRVVNQEPDQYTWWSNRGRAWEKNVGWRIDYQIVSPSLKEMVNKATIFRRKRFSDHAPLIIDYDVELT